MHNNRTQPAVSPRPQLPCVLCRPPPQAINAAPYGVVGVLVYTDPLDINDGLMSDVNETYPHSWYLPPSGVERGGYATDFGDLLTPYLAAKGERTQRHFGPDAIRRWAFTAVSIVKTIIKSFCATLIFSLTHMAEETYRIPEADITGIPPIPTQPIGFEDAQALIWFVMMQNLPRLRAKRYTCVYK